MPWRSVTLGDGERTDSLGLQPGVLSPKRRPVGGAAYSSSPALPLARR
jgi:hypothetical protein